MDINTNDFKLTTPVAFFTFNRLDTAKQVFAQIKKVQPPKLYLVSDGPRNNRAGEDLKVKEVRDYLEANIDWDCEVYKNYAPSNMGCGKRMSSGIGWVFDNEEMAIFLEDDCVPELSFFEYCQELLIKYKDNEEVMVICGNNQIAKHYSMESDYAFSHILNIWGWGGYRRTWQDYDFDLKDWPQDKKLSVWKEIYTKKAYWTLMSEYDLMYKHGCDTWDYQVSNMMGKKKGYCIIPRVNMISNAGFDSENSTHTADQPDWMDLTSSQMDFPMKHPDGIEWTRGYDEALSELYFKHGLTVRVKSMLGFDINKSIVDGVKGIFKK